MDMFGLRNIADAASTAADGNQPELSADYIVAAKPQLIFLIDSEAEFGGQTPAIVAARPGWAAIPAGREAVFSFRDRTESFAVQRIPGATSGLERLRTKRASIHSLPRV